VWREIAPHVHSLMGSPQAVLDPAAGWGEFIEAIDARERVAIDEVDYEQAGRDSGVRRITSRIQDAELPGGHFDGIFVSNFLEHLPSQVEISAFLERMREAMAPVGRIAIMGPNYRYCSREYWDYADHIIALTHRAVEEHLYTAGFEPERTIPQYLPYSFTGKLPPSRLLTRLYLRTPLAWRMLGKQFLVIGRK
jgi:cyclopropane fatty-acyl-phospholipid synthase-like methyltransferase